MPTGALDATLGSEPVRCRNFRPRWTHCVNVGVQNQEVIHEQGSAGHSAKETSIGSRRTHRQRPKDLPLLRCRPVRVLRLEEGYETHGDEGLINKKPCPYNPRLRTPPEIVEKVLHLRRTYHLGPIRIVWYLERYHGITICDATVYRILRRHGLNRLPSRVGRRAVHTHRYTKQVPGHHVQVDVTFLKLIGPRGRAIRRYQYTAIDDATRIRALKVYTRHTQTNAIRFLDDVVTKFPFRIHTAGVAGGFPNPLRAGTPSGCEMPVSRRPGLRPRVARGHPCADQVHWQRKDQRRVLVARDLGCRLQIP